MKQILLAFVLLLSMSPAQARLKAAPGAPAPVPGYDYRSQSSTAKNVAYKRAHPRKIVNSKHVHRSKTKVKRSR